MILGKNLIMTMGSISQGLASSKSCKLEISTDFIEVCSPTEGSWKEYLPTVKGWSASVDCLVARMSDHRTLLQLQDSNTRLACCFYDTDLQEFYKGYVYIKNLNITGSVGGLVTMSVSLQPTGKLEWAEEQAIDMTTATEVADKSIQWIGGLSGDAFSIMSMSDVNIMIHELTLTTDTRITIGKGIVVNADAATVTTYIGNKNAQSINAAAILINSTTAEKSVVVKTQSAIVVTVICNEDDLTTLKYLSKF